MKLSAHVVRTADQDVEFELTDEEASHFAGLTERDDRIDYLRLLAREEARSEDGWDSDDEVDFLALFDDNEDRVDI